MLSDVRRLRALEAVASRRSFSAAADDLGYTQSAISQQIVALEREVGLTLVERGVRPVELTDAGRRLLEHVAPVFEHLATAEAELDALRGLRGGRLRVAGFPSAFATFLPPALAAFTRAHPDVEIALRECEPPEALRLLRSGQVDVAVVYEWAEAPAGPAEGLALHELGTDPVRVVLDARHRLARRRRPLALHQLGSERWIVPRADGAAPYRAALERLWADAGIQPEIALETDDPVAAQRFAATGLGLVLVNELILAPPGPDVAVLPLTGGVLDRRVAAAVAQGRRWPASDALIELLVRERPSATPARAPRAASRAARARR